MASNDILVTLRADMKDLQNSFKTLQDSLTDTENSTDGLSDTLGKLGKVAGLTIIAKQAVELGKTIVETGKSFEYEMSKVQAISGATGEEFEALSELAKELGATTLFSATDAAQGMQYLAMAGWSTSEVMEGLPAILQLSIASGTDLARVADIASDAMTAFGLQANEAGHFSDVLAYASSKANVNVETLGEAFKYVAPLAQTTNQSMETVTSAISKLGDAGIKGSEAGTALRAILNRLASGNASTVKAMEELGVSVYDNEGKMKNLSTIIGEVTQATAGMDDEQKNTLFSLIAGTEALSAWNVLMGVGEEGLKSFTAELENADGSAQAMADTMGDNLKGSLDNLESAIEGVQIALYEKMKEPLRAVVDAMTEAIEWIMDLDKWYNDHKGTVLALGSAFLVLASGITAFAIQANSAKLLKALGSLKTAMFGVAKSVLSTTVAFLTSPISWIAMAIAGLVVVGVLLWKNWDTVKAKCIEVWGAVKDWFSEVWTAISSKCSEIWNSISEYLNGVWNSIKETATAVWTAVSSFFVSVWEGIKTCFNVALEFIKGIISTVFTAIKTVIETIWNAVVSVFQAIWDKIGTIVMTAVGLVRAIITAVFQAILILVAIIWTNISAVILAVWEVIKTVVTTTVNAVKAVIETVFNAIKNFIVPLWEGVRDFFKELWNGIKKVFSDALNIVKEYVSQKFNEVKTYIVEKWNSIKQYFSDIWDGIKSIIRSAVDYVKQIVSEKFNQVKAFISSVWDGIKSATRSAWELVKNYVITPVANICSKVMSAFESLKDGIIGIWNGIKSGIVGVINAIIRAINSMIGAMNKFSFDVPDWVPIMGGKSFGFNIPKIPEISWHAKGGIFTKPTVIGNHGFGEAGKEAILPLGKLPQLIGMDKQQELIDKILAGEAGATGGTTINIERFENNREQDVAQLAKELEYYRQRYNFAKGVR